MAGGISSSSAATSRPTTRGSRSRRRSSPAARRACAPRALPTPRRRSSSARPPSASPRGPGAAPEGVTFVFVLDTALGAAGALLLGRGVPARPRRRAGGRRRAARRAARARPRGRAPRPISVPGVTLVSKWEETVAWLTFAESVRSARVAEGVSRRLETRGARPRAPPPRGGKDRRPDRARPPAHGREPAPRGPRAGSRPRPGGCAARRAPSALCAATARRPSRRRSGSRRGPERPSSRIEGEIGRLELVVTARPDAPRQAAAAPRPLGSPSPGARAASRSRPTAGP